MRFIETKLLPPGAQAFTVYPIGAFVKPGAMDNDLKIHESVHWEHQRAWCIYGLGVGLLLWFMLYLMLLPVGWNPLRAWTERAAFRAQGVTDEYITHMLQRAPYYLWWKQ